jgi:DNA-directed RNA polymerase subunit RPC12/RpoP
VQWFRDEEVIIVATSCLQCATELPLAAKFCANCGVASATSPPAIDSPSAPRSLIATELPPNLQTDATKTSTATNVGTGGCLGLFLIIVGILLCFTVVGSLLGIPLILGGLMAPFVTAIQGKNWMEGKCPVCGTAMSITHLGANCPACKKRIVLKDKSSSQSIEQCKGGGLVGRLGQVGGGVQPGNPIQQVFTLAPASARARPLQRGQADLCLVGPLFELFRVPTTMLSPEK